MSNLQIIEELCRICEAQSAVIREQAAALAQVGAVVMEEERENISRAIAALTDEESGTAKSESRSATFSGDGQ